MSGVGGVGSPYSDSDFHRLVLSGYPGLLPPPRSMPGYLVTLNSPVGVNVSVNMLKEKLWISLYLSSVQTLPRLFLKENLVLLWLLDTFWCFEE